MTAQSSPTAIALGGRLCYPTAKDVGGRKRVRSRNFFEPGSDPEIVSKKGQNTKFGRLVRGEGMKRMHGWHVAAACRV